MPQQDFCAPADSTIPIQLFTGGQHYSMNHGQKAGFYSMTICSQTARFSKKQYFGGQINAGKQKL